jgi:hypothetical protein
MFRSDRLRLDTKPTTAADERLFLPSSNELDLGIDLNGTPLSLICPSPVDDSDPTAGSGE